MYPHAGLCLRHGRGGRSPLQGRGAGLHLFALCQSDRRHVREAHVRAGRRRRCPRHRVRHGGGDGGVPVQPEGRRPHRGGARAVRLLSLGGRDAGAANTASRRRWSTAPTSPIGKRRSGPTPRLFFLESPTNPTLEVIDIAAVAKLADQAGARLVVDNVFATPLAAEAAEARRPYRRLFRDQAHRRPGPLPRRRHPVRQEVDRREPARLFPPHRPGLSPFNAWTLLKGLETLPLRVRQQTESAAQRSPTSSPSIRRSARVIYPGRTDHPQADIIERQMTGGSTLICFDAEGRQAGRLRLQNALDSC